MHSNEPKIKFSISRNTGILLLYILTSLLVFLFFALPVLHGKLDMKFYSDTDVYEKIYYSQKYSISELISVRANLLGPVLIISLFRNNYFLIYCFNVLIFISSYRTIIRNFQINENRFLALLIINPYILVSLLSVNKEILAVFVLAQFLQYLNHRNLSRLIFILIISILVRWQYTLFILAVLFLDSQFNFFRGRRLLSVFGILVTISIVYPFLIYSVFGRINETGLARAIQHGDQGSGIFAVLTNIQNNFGYILVFPLKVFQLFFGYLTKIKLFFDFNFTIYILQCFAYLVLFMFYFLRKINLGDRIIYLALLYASVFALMPFVVPRYFLPVYILFSLYISKRFTGANIGNKSDILTVNA